MNCPACGELVLPGETLCGECGAELVVDPAAAPPAPVAAPLPDPAWIAALRTCPDCHEKVSPDANGWCPSCGYPFDGIELPLAGAFPPIDADGLPASAPADRTPDFTDALGAHERRERRAANFARSLADAPVDPQAAARVRLHEAWVASAGITGPSPPPPTPGGLAAERPAPPVAHDGWLIVEQGGRVFHEGRMTDRIRLDVDQLVIGRRDPDAGHFPDIDLTHHHPDDPHLSRRHARVLRRAGGWIVEDLSGNAATWLNDRAHLLDREVATLSHGDRILVSDSVVLRFDAGTLPP